MPRRSHNLYNRGAAGDVDVDVDEVRGVLAAIAPILGTARVAFATGKIVQALGIAIDLAELEADEAHAWDGRGEDAPRSLSVCRGDRNHQGDRPASVVCGRQEVPSFGAVPGRTYQLIVAGELSDQLGAVFEGMTLTRVEGTTMLSGHIRGQAELQGPLQRVSDLGLTLLEVKAGDEDVKRRAGARAEIR